MLDKLLRSMSFGFAQRATFQGTKPEAYPDMLTTSGKFLPEPTEVVVAGAGAGLSSVAIRIY